jgi:hypothetical protein
MASASRESVFGVQTSTARKNHRSGHTEGQFDHHAKRVLRAEGTIYRTLQRHDDNDSSAR